MTTTRGSGSWRAAFWGPGCDRQTIVAAYWIISSGKIQCHQDAVPAFRALGRVMRAHGYQVRRDVTGCYNCRPITGGTAPSAHSQGIALDVNWDTNPYRTDRVITDMPRDMVESALALTTTDGIPLFRWGGDWDNRPETPNSNYDAMHWEVIATPEEIRRKVLVPDFDEDKQSLWPLLAVGDRGPAVKKLQQYIMDAGSAWMITTDGLFGPLTAQAVGAYQVARKMPGDGVVGMGTWTALLTQMPPLGEGDPSPHKQQGTMMTPLS
jgi:hypothetical protein